MSDENSVITLTLDKNEAGVTFAALKGYEQTGTEAGDARRLLVKLLTGVDPVEQARLVREKIDEAACAIWGGEPEDYSGDVQTDDGGPVPA